MSVNTDPDKIKAVLTRGVSKIYPEDDFLFQQLASGKQLKIYSGIDPTAKTLHLGHGMVLLKLKKMQELGHKIILLIGDFTAMIGDPTDKMAVRKKLTREEVLDNCANYKEQIGRILDFDGDNPAELKYNSEWFSQMNFADVLELSSKFTVQRMLERDMFARRLDSGKPIYIHEFLYPLLQGYDSVALDVDLEIGGNDQIFNMLVGRTLLKELKHKEKAVLALKLLTDNSGQKMSKTANNMIALNDKPEDAFGKIMNWPDEFIINGFEMCTYKPLAEIEDIKKQIKAGANPRDFKLVLAKEIISIFFGVEQAEQAQNYFEQVIQKKELPDNILEIKPDDYTVLQALKQAKYISSNSEFRRLITQKGIKLNGEVIEDLNTSVKSGDIIQKGKRFFLKIV